jgi:hypothetical protein
MAAVSNKSWVGLDVIKKTSGDNTPPTDTIPYKYLQGSDVGVSDTINDTKAEALWPTYTTATPPVTTLPSDWTLSTSVSYDIFSTWHSQVQAYWMDKNGLTTKTLTDSNSKQHEIVRSAESPKVFVVDLLSKRDFASISKTDQERIAGTTYFKATLAALYGLVPSTASGSTATDIASARTAVATVISAYKAKIDTAWNFSSSLNTDRDVFKSEITNIETRLATMAIFSIPDITTQLETINTRSNRAAAFGKSTNEGTDNAIPFTSNYKQPVSLDDGATIQSGYTSMMAQERRMLALDNARLDLAQKTGQFADRRLDAPTLIFLFQQYTNQIVEADVAAKTEEINQLNAYLKTISVIQKYVGQTTGAFNPSKSDQQLGWLNRSNTVFSFSNNNKDYPTYINSINSSSSVTKEDMQALMMIEDVLGSKRKHPLSTLYSIALPTMDIIENVSNVYNGIYKTKWDSLATSLSDTVTLLNQESQVKMNEVNSAEKQKNRHFELANNALSKMYDILQNVARAG